VSYQTGGLEAATNVWQTGTLSDVDIYIDLLQDVLTQHNYQNNLFLIYKIAPIMFITFADHLKKSMAHIR